MIVPPIVPFLAALAAQRQLSAKALAKKPAPKVAKFAGATVGVGAATVLLGTLVQYRNQATTVDPRKPATTASLITTGPNRLTRNPIYVGFAGALAAHALWRGSVAALLPVLGFAAAVSPQIEAEEDALMDKFPAEYGSYVRRVPRWL